MEKYFSISNLDCAHCGAKIEEAISKLEGIESAVLNFPMKKFKIKGDLTEELIAKINEVANSIEAGVIIAPQMRLIITHDHDDMSMNIITTTMRNAAAVTTMSMSTTITTMMRVRLRSRTRASPPR